MRRDFLTIKDKVEILIFKIKAKRLFCRLINMVCKNPDWNTILAVVNMEYVKVGQKSGMYPDLIRFIYEQLLIDEAAEETEE